MSESDSFISEVTEEVRRERLYRTLRRYAWVLIAAILLIVGGAAWHAWSTSRDQARAEAAGDALRAALAVEDPAARAEALAALQVGSAAPVARIAEAGALLEAGQRDAAAEALAAVAADGATPEPLRSLAALQRVMALGMDLASSERIATLEGLAAEGAPYRLLALEQRALALIETGDAAGARADLEEIAAAPTAPEGLRGRAQQLLVALDGPQPDDAADAAEAGSGG